MSKQDGMANTGRSPAMLEQLRRQYGLDKLTDAQVISVRPKDPKEMAELSPASFFGQIRRRIKERTAERKAK